MIRFALAAMLTLAPLPLVAGEAQVVSAEAVASGSTWRISVTIAHGDTGWDHYANGWAVLDEAGNELGYRVLAHPHVNEQPFTRSLSGVAVPSGVRSVFIRADDSVHGQGNVLFEVPLK